MNNSEARSRPTSRSDPRKAAKRSVVCWIAFIILFGILTGSAQTTQTNVYLFSGTETNITLGPGTYDIKAYGAQGGGYYSGGNGGIGAEMEGIINFTNATTLTLLVGGAGQGSANGGGAGGGGGSFVVETNTPLVVAGGGGGGGNVNGGGNGLTGTSGGDTDAGPGGTNGYGGGGGLQSGGGYYGGGDAASGGASSFLDGGAGGSGGAGSNGGGYGGGGGGGGSGAGSGGGGGGYSGGRGGGYGTAGGGGGSYIDFDSSAVVDFNEISGVASPDDSPNGEIIIYGGLGALLTNTLINPANSTITNIFPFTGTISNITMSPGVYFITAYGAQGGSYPGGWYSPNSGGLGAEMEAEFYITTATRLTLLAGGAGGNGANSGGGGPGGGGGGSFVMQGSTPLVVAGGGGGAAWFGPGGIGGTTNTGSNGDGGGGAGGSNGSGGNASSVDGGGGGGGGYSGTGSNNYSAQNGNGTCGGGYLSGGGLGGGNYYPGSGGGFGGGGGAGFSGGGGAGGYSGGGGGGSGGGGGGGSIIDSSAIGDLAHVSGVASPNGSTNGEIIIESLPTNNMVLLTQPSSQAVPGGQTATFSVLAVYSPPFSYQWFCNGTNIVGATNATYSIPDVQPDNDGAYSVVVADAVTNITSSNAVLTVIYPPPVIVLEPTNSGAIVGSNATFFASATSYYPMSLQWQFDGTNLVDGGQISGSTNSSLTISSAAVANNGSYQFIASNSYGAVTSSIASLTVLDPIQIIAQPTNQILFPGSNVNFTVTATGPISSYQWYFDGSPLTDGGNVSGSISPTLILTNVQPSNSGNYAVVLANAFFSSTSSNALLINPTPVIVSSPTNLAIISGSNAVFSIYATNYLPLSYQWQFNGTNLTDGGPISGSTNSVLIIAGAENANAGAYQVIAFDDFSATTSSVASLTVYAPPQIIGQPSSETVLSGTNISFTVTATGSLLNYQWFCNGLSLTNNGNISGTTNSTLTITSVQTNNDGVYWAWVTSLSSAEVSSNATLTVYNPAQIAAQPANVGALLGSNASLTVSATGTAIGYQWYFNGTPMADNGHVTGSVTPTLNITNVGSSDGGDYRVLVSNLLSSTLSRRATLTPLTNLAPSIRYVNVSNSTPASPYLSWSSAATKIQDAVDASLAGDAIIVQDGVYQAAGDVSSDGITNCVLVPITITIQSVNGAGATIINGGNAARCVYLTNGAALSGFTLTNGRAYHSSGQISGFEGGGVFCVSSNASISNSCIVGNLAVRGGGGYNGTYFNCTFTGNTATNLGSLFGAGGGCDLSVLSGCSLNNNSSTYSGGGAQASTLSNCFLYGNFSYQGGGAVSSTLDNCIISNNVALPESAFGNSSINPGMGGGAFGCVVQNCLIISNSAQNSRLLGGIGGGAYGGVYASILTNCVIQGNWAYLGGGAYYASSQAPIVMNQCTFAGNWAFEGGGFYSSSSVREPILTNCTITGNWAGTGGGVYSANLANCTVTGNWATNSGGGAAYFCIVNNCSLIGNSATNYGGGTYQGCTLKGCLVSGNIALQGGGGVSGNSSSQDPQLNDCILQFNSAPIGGGAYEAFLNDCLVVSNSAGSIGGGGERGEMYNCTVVGNSSGGIGGGGDSIDNTYNSIVYNNSAAAGGANITNSYLEYCCTTPMPNAGSGFGNITNAPLVANPTGGNFQLQSDSPCINSGNNAYAPSGNDLDGNPRIVGGTVDIGAYEYQTPTSFISYAYLQQYGLPTDGSVDFKDLDGTAFNVYQDWIAGLNPTNSASILAMLTPVTTNTSTGVTVTWQSVSGIPYFLQRSTNLASQPPFSTIQSSIIGQTNTTSYVDTSATNGVPYFYRVGVVAP